MRSIRNLVCRVDDASPDCMTELTAIAAETSLDTLESTTIAAGHTILRVTLQAQREEIDAHLEAA